MNGEKILDISWGTILKISVAVLVLYFLYLIRDLIIWFLFALIISILFNPAIDFFQKRKVPRVISVIFIYLLVFGILTLFIYLLAPFFISEIQQFSRILPQYFEKVSPPLTGLGIEAFENIESFIDFLGKALERMAGNIFNALFSIFGGIFATIFVITVGIFLSLEEKIVERSLALIFPKKYEAYVLDLWKKIQKKVSGWFGVRILGCIFVGVTCFGAFLLFNIKYPFALALLAGVLEFIPIVGPILTGIILFFLISLDSLLKAIFVLVFFIIIQQIEGNFLTPVLTKKFIGLPPALVLIALAIGGTLWGILGAILCVPLAGILFEFTRDFLKKRKEGDTSPSAQMPPPAGPKKA